MFHYNILRNKRVFPVLSLIVASFLIFSLYLFYKYTSFHHILKLCGSQLEILVDGEGPFPVPIYELLLKKLGNILFSGRYLIFFVNTFIHLLNAYLLYTFMSIKKAPAAWRNISTLIFLFLLSPFCAKFSIHGLSFLLVSSLILATLLLHHFYNMRKGIVYFSFILILFHLALYINMGGVILLPLIILDGFFEKRLKSNFPFLYLPLAFITLFYIFLSIRRFYLYDYHNFPYKIGFHIFTNVFKFYIYLWFPTATSKYLYPFLRDHGFIFYSLLFFNFLSSVTLPIFIFIYLNVKDILFKISLFFMFISFIPFLPFSGEYVSTFLYIPSLFFAVIAGYIFYTGIKNNLKLRISSFVILFFYLSLNFIPHFLI